MNESRTPRDWLLARHAPANPGLDRIRRDALPTPSMTWRDFLRELFSPDRTAWRTLAIVWLGLIAMHFTLGRLPRPTLANPPPPDAVAAWLAQLKSNETLAQIDRRP